MAFKKSRYTSKSLERDLASYNEGLERNKSPYRLVIGGSYGMTSVDLATVEQVAKHICERRLEIGTPRECLAASDSFYSRELVRLYAPKNA